MVHVVEYGSLPQPRLLASATRRQAYGRFMAVAAAALATVCVIGYLNASVRTTALEEDTREYFTDPVPSHLNDDQVRPCSPSPLYTSPSAPIDLTKVDLKAQR